jgi:hypothetical protein
MEIRLDKSDLNRAKRMLADCKNGFPKAFSRALNKTTTGTRTDMVDLVRSDYNYKATAIRKRISVQKSTQAVLSAAVRSSGGSVHLTDIATTRQTKKGVTVNVKKSTGRQLIPRAFIRPAKRSGKKIVFRRQEQNGRMVGRLPIEARYASHPEIIYNTPENWNKLEKSSGARLNKNFAHEVDVILKGIA